MALSTSINTPNHQFDAHRTDGLVTDENAWAAVRKQFQVDDHYLDFRCHAASSLPASVLLNLTQEITHIQTFPSLRNHEPAPGAQEPLRAALADELNCSVGEVALMRSTTEALNNVIMGFPFQRGDEVIGSVHEYDSMYGSLYQQQQRLGITIKQIDIPYQPESTEQILDIWRKSITPKTRMFLISHIVWISGQVYPVQEICALARQHNIYTVIDAAQSFSHIPVDVTVIGCDYLGASLHKWATGPLGTGFLYIKKKNIAMTLPLLGHYQYQADEEVVEKFENFGSMSPVFHTAALSLAFWKKLGHGLKTARMQYLKAYWTEKLRTLPGVTIRTNTDPTQSCGLAYFALNNRSAKEVGRLLMDNYGIFVHVTENYKNRYVDYKDVNVIGIATPVFITPKQLDRLYTALRAIV